MSRTVRIPVPDAGAVAAVPGWLDGAAGSPWLLVLAPGAGAPADSDFMSDVAAAIAAGGVRVLRFDFPYQVRARAEGRRKPPDRAAVLLATWRGVLAYVKRRLRPAHVAVGGKSMGGRYATLLLADASEGGDPLPCEADACVLLGYPLHPPGKPDRLRADHLPAVAVPTLFVSGTRDSLAGIDAVREVVGSLPQAHLHEIPDADHDFKVPKRTGRRRADVVAEIGSTTAGYLSGFGSILPPSTTE